MIPEELTQVLDVSRARERLGRGAPWDGVAVYVLWDRLEDRPVYCGTARSPARLRGHLHKDDLVNGPVGKTHVNPGLRAYCLSRPKGWLGVSWIMLPDATAATALERAVIARWGIRSQGGLLFNQRLSG